MFWKQNGKIIKNEKGIVNCETCPCEPISSYYAVFGFKYRSLDKDTMEPYDECAWDFEVNSYFVDNGTIIWNETSIPVKPQQGEVGYKKFKEGCWSECYEENEDGECIDEWSECDYVYEVYVYNLTGCISDKERFLDLFFEDCDEERNSEGKYEKDPFSDDYYKIPGECYDKWLEKFTKLYALTFKVNINYKIQQWWVAGLYYKYKWERWCECEDDGYESDSPCPDDCNEYWDTDDYSDLGAIALRSDLSKEGPEISEIYKYFSSGAEENEWGYIEENCCNTNKARARLPEASDFMFSYIDKKEYYRTSSTSRHECNESNRLCFDFEYNSWGRDNPYGDIDSCYYDFKWATLKLERLDNTPSDAIGVKFKVNKKRTHINKGYDVDPGETITEEVIEIDLLFDEEYTDLPISDDITRPRYISLMTCNDECWGEPDTETKIEPYPTGSWAGWEYKHDNWTEIWKFKFVGMEYIRHK